MADAVSEWNCFLDAEARKALFSAPLTEVPFLGNRNERSTNTARQRREQRRVGSQAAIASTPLNTVTSCLCRQGFPLPSRFGRPVHSRFPSVAQDSGAQAQRCQRRSELAAFPGIR